MQPLLPHVLKPDATVDLVGVLISVVVPGLMALLVSSDKARQATQAILSIYNLYRAFRERNRPKPAPVPVSNGNGNGHTKGNGNGVPSDLLKSFMQTIRSETDARESGDETLDQKLAAITERGRRDSDNFYMLYSELSSDSKRHEENIRLLKLETAKTQSQMILMFKEQGDKLEMILHYVQPLPPTPPGDVIPLDDSDDLEAAS